MAGLGDLFANYFQPTADPEADARKAKVDAALAKAKARSAEIKANPNVERYDDSLNWADIGKGVASNIRSGLESIPGSLGDLGRMGKTATNWAMQQPFDLLGEKGRDVASTILNPTSLLPGTEDVGKATDYVFGRDPITRYEPTTSQGKSAGNLANFMSSMVSGPESLAPVLAAKAAILAPKLAALGKGVAGAGFLFPAGRLAKGLEDTAPELAKTLAVKLEKSGASPEEVFKQTGYFRDLGDNWLYEYGDQGIKPKPPRPNYATPSDVGEAKVFKQSTPPMKGDTAAEREARPGPPVLSRARESFQDRDWRDPDQLSFFEGRGYSALDPSEKAVDVSVRRGRNEGARPTFADVYEHPVQDMYLPEVRELPVSVEYRDEGGYYMPPTKGIAGSDYIKASGTDAGAGAGPGAAESTVLHEVGHKAQNLQGMPAGANWKQTGIDEVGEEAVRRARAENLRLEQLKGKEYEDLLEAGYSTEDALKQAAFDPEMQKAIKRTRTGFRKSVDFGTGEDLSFKGYLADEGETMSRLAQQRAKLSAKEQGDTHPFRQLDLPPEAIFNRQGYGGANWISGSGRYAGSFPDQGKFDWLLGDRFYKNRVGGQPAAHPIRPIGTVDYKYNDPTSEMPVPVEEAAPPLAKPAVRTRSPEVTSRFSSRPDKRSVRPDTERTATYEQSGPDLLDAPLFNPEEIPIGSAIFQGRGDRSETGKKLLSINDKPLENPVELGGGYNYQRGVEQQGADKSSWRSAKHVIDNFIKNQREAEKITKGGRTFFGNSVMGETGVDFSDQMTRAVIEDTRNLDLSKGQMTDLDKLVRKEKGGANWPGFEAIMKDKSLIDDWVKGGGPQRQAVTNALDSETAFKIGAPDLADSRWAITAPELRGTETGMGNQVMSEMDPGGRRIDKPLIERADYSTGWGGKLFSRMPEGIPHDVMLHDYVQKMREKAKAKGVDLTKQMELYGIERAQPFQIWTQEQLDRVMNYLKTREGKAAGFGGAMAAGLITKAQAEDLDKEMSPGA